ncbi:MAG TPA: TlyA family RNA methyltransferase [Acidobacteriaceae bacterium]|nr:TlyA family RNA methyltransferase [Acidobacteriaceae bacterium]
MVHRHQKDAAEKPGPARSRQARLRLDKLLVDRGLVPSRERAQAMILAGRVLVNEQKVEKPGQAVAEDAAVRLLGEDLRYVGRGGLKLEAALAHWKIDLTGRFCLDVGASTGGFTDCMLQNEAARVLAIDTGYGQIAERLRRDPRVQLMERTNARKLQPAELPVGISFMAMDVSFISSTLVLPAVRAAVGSAQPLEAVILVKPQFEAGRESVGKGGIVRDPKAHSAAIERVRAGVLSLGGEEVEVIDSPIHGAEGNKEFLLHAGIPALSLH